MAIPREIIEEIVSRTDIEQLVGSYVSLKRTGSNLSGLCPFHSEKTPSFTVTPAKNMFYCFGCGAGGNAITFVQKAENLDFFQAVEFLAQRAGITIPRDEKYKREEISRNRIYDMNREAAKFFRACLYDPKYGGDAMAYLKDKRRLGDAVIKHFGLGFSPNDFGLLTKHMQSLGFKEEELTKGFLCGKSQKTGRLYDYFRNRVMFPIIDVSGNIIGFGGRVMDDSKPKYLNTSDTPGFKKSKNLFALNYAKNFCENQMLLCEGYMDVIAMHAAGFQNAVATLGTALTSEQARLMTKYTKKVVVCYDSDEAGQRAADRSIKILGEVGLDVRILKMQGAKDPDEYIKTFGADRLKLALDESRTWFDFKVNGIFAKYDLTAAGDRVKASQEVSAVIAGVHSPVEREIYITHVAPLLGLTPEIMKNNIEREVRRRKADEESKELQNIKLSVRNYGDKVNPDAVKNVAANAAEEAILGMLLMYDEHREAVKNGKIEISPDDFFTALGRKIFEKIMELHSSEGGFSMVLMGEDFNADEMGRIQELLRKREELTDNGTRVLVSNVEALKSAKRKASGGGLEDILKAKRDKLGKKND